MKRTGEGEIIGDERDVNERGAASELRELDGIAVVRYLRWFKNEYACGFRAR